MHVAPLPIGSRHGFLTVLSEPFLRPVGNQGRYRSYHVFRCERCGTQCEAARSEVVTGHTKSCGCLQRDQGKINVKYASAAIQTHGFSKSRIYIIWAGMKNRCYVPKTRSYDRYGGRGITVCDEWRYDFLAFKHWAEENGYAADLQIDRINGNGNYEPSNCRWATPLENNHGRIPGWRRKANRVPS